MLLELHTLEHATWHLFREHLLALQRMSAARTAHCILSRMPSFLILVVVVDMMVPRVSLALLVDRVCYTNFLKKDEGIECQECQSVPINI